MRELVSVGERAWVGKAIGTWVPHCGQAVVEFGSEGGRAVRTDIGMGLVVVQAESGSLEVLRESKKGVSCISAGYTGEM